MKKISDMQPSSMLEYLYDSLEYAESDEERIHIYAQIMKHRPALKRLINILSTMPDDKYEEGLQICMALMKSNGNKPS